MRGGGFMLEAGDLTYLRRSQTRGARIGAWVLAVVACVIVVGAILNIRLAARFATMQGIGFGELLHQWFQGVKVDAQYSGLFLFAMNRLQMGIFGLAFGIIMGIIFCGYSKSRQRNKRILKCIEECSQRSL
jgi:ABC-type phosphate/phosphonate transport system permease subunit